jgi:CheY-like chemotaxis protein
LPTDNLLVREGLEQLHPHASDENRRGHPGCRAVAWVGPARYLLTERIHDRGQLAQPRARRYRREWGFQAAGGAASGAEALEPISHLHVRLALVDVRMPGMDGVETARRLRAADPAIVVVLISLEDSRDLPSSASHCGAAGLVRKQDFGPGLLRELWAAHGD